MLWAAVSPISQYIVRRARPSRWLLHWLLVRCAQTPTCTRCQVSVVHEAPIPWASSYPQSPPARGSPSAGARRGERRDHRSISGRYLHPDRKSVTNAQSGGRCLSPLQRDRPQPVQELLRGADDEHAPILPADGPVLAAYSGQPARADMTERQRGPSRVRRACAAGGRVAVVALADPYMSVWQGTVSAGRCLVVRIRGTAGVTVGRIDRVPGSEDGRFERGGPGRTCDGAG